MSDPTDIRPHPRTRTAPPGIAMPATCKNCAAPVALRWGGQFRWYDPETNQPHVCPTGDAA